MALLRYLERNRARSDEIKAVQARLGAELRLRLDLGEDEVVRVGEVGCAAPDCPDVETVFLLLGLGRRTQVAKLPVPMAAVGAADLDDVAARLGADRRGPAEPAR